MNGPRNWFRASNFEGLLPRHGSLVAKPDLLALLQAA
jgi:hypothetical protein